MPHADSRSETAPAGRAASPLGSALAGEAGSRRTTITFYLTEALRNRARAAYRSTSFTEKDSSWSEMLNKALLAEVERREREHNDGATFEGGDEPLAPGRPIGF